MRFRTTLVMLILVLLGVAYIYLIDNKLDSRGYGRDRLRRMFRFEPEKVIAFEIETSDETVECRLENNDWRIVRPFNARADNAVVNRFLSALRKLESKTVITRKERTERDVTVGDYGLVPPRAVVRIQGEGFRRLLNIGRSSSDAGSVYVACDNAKEDIFSVEAELLDAIPMEALNLRSKQVFSTDPKAVNRVELKTSEGFISLNLRGDGTWMLQQPFVARADRIKVERLIEALCRLQVAIFLPDASSDAAIYGFDEVESTVALKGSVDILGSELYFGLPLPEDPNMLYASFKGEDSVFAIPSATLDALKQLDPRNLRDRRLIDLTADEIEALRLRNGGSTLEFSKRDTGWAMIAPRSWEAEDERVENLLATLASARIEEFIAFDEESGWGAGFSTNSLRVGISELSDSDAKSMPDDPKRWVELEFRDQLARDGLAGVRRSESEWIYLTNEKLLESISLDPLFYKSHVVMALSADEIKGIQLNRAGEEQILERDDHGLFHPKTPKTSGDPVLLPQQGRMELLRSLRCLRYVASGDFSPDEYGLENPNRTMTIILADDSGISRTLLIGKALADGAVYARLRGQDSVFVLDEKIVNTLFSDLYATVEK